MPLSRAQMPQISILASKDTQLYPCTQKSQKTPFKRVSAYAPLSPGISIRAYAHICTRVYIIICPHMHLSPYLCICIYPCSYMQLYAGVCSYTAMCTCLGIHTPTYIEAGICRGMSMCVCMYSYVYSYVQICTATSVCRDRQIYAGTDTQPSMCMHQEPP